MNQLLHSLSAALFMASCAITPNLAESEGVGTSAAATDDGVKCTATFMVDWPGKTISAYPATATAELKKLWMAIETAAHGDKTLYPDPLKPQLREFTVEALNGIPIEAQVQQELNLMVAKFNDAYIAASGGTDPFFKNLAATGLTENFLVTEHMIESSNSILAEDSKHTKEFSCVRYEWIAGKLVAIYNYKLVAHNKNHEPENLANLNGTSPVYCVVARFTLNEK